MSSNEDQIIESYREEHECEEHWELRKAFLLHWRHKYPEDRLLCLARVFSNIEFMGCRYPPDVMKEVAMLSDEVAKNYRSVKKTKLQRTFVSASDAAEDRARGVKRVAGVIEDGCSKAKMNKINFVAQGEPVIEINDSPIEIQLSDDETQAKQPETLPEQPALPPQDYEYLKELQNRQNLDVRFFNERMFNTGFGKLVLIIRPWMCKMTNIQASCSSCGLLLQSDYSGGSCTVKIENNFVAQCSGSSRQVAKTNASEMAWKRLLKECITVVVKEQFIAHGDQRISIVDVNAKVGKQNADTTFGTPVDSSVAAKMMKLMGWSGGGLGANSDGIDEPIKPNLNQIHRAGLGSKSSGSEPLRVSALRLMREYSSGDTLDLDLVFANDFTKEERAELHQIAKRCGLISKSYGKDAERFLVVKKKLDPFNLVRAVLQKGGQTNKYQIFIPNQLKKFSR